MLAAHRADAAFDGLGQIDGGHVAQIARKVQAGIMVTLLVRAAHEARAGLDGIVKQHGDLAAQILGANEAGAHANLVQLLRGMHLALQVVAQLDLVHLEIAADEHDHNAVVGFLLIGHGLQKSAHVLVQELRHFLDGLHLGRRDLGERLLLAGHGLVLAVGVFHVCAVVAVRANHQIVLADGRAQHELVRHLAAPSCRCRT